MPCKQLSQFSTECKSYAMFTYRDRESKASVTRQLLPVMEIAAAHDQLPLKDENWSERWCTVPKGFNTIFERIFNFEIRDDDVFVDGFMKSGTTWMHEAIWQLMNGLDFNYTTTKDEQSGRFLEFIHTSKYAGCEARISKFEKQTGPRLFQTHLPVNLLPKQFWQKKPKTIYVARNVKDVVVSGYHFLQWMRLWRGTMDEFVQDFMNNATINTSFWAHIVDFWKLRHESHIYFVTYEEMTRDLAGVIKKLCVFLEIPELTDAELNALLEHLSFKQMKCNDKANPTSSIKSYEAKYVDPSIEFMRRGIVGSYKDELSVENQNLLNEWSRKFLAKHDIKEEDIFGCF